MSIFSAAPSARSQKSANIYTDAEKGGYNPTYSAALPTSFSKTLGSKLAQDGNPLNPDELFTRHTVPEIRGIQHRLRTEAEAKQEELRLMVGERYRDLLQASSSIISIAQSSQRVQEALEESRGAILSQHITRLPQKASQPGGLDDHHLHVLQVLSAHVKLLLDAPEHLWRLIEKRKWFAAAWLFLLTRVIHRALVRKDDDEQPWITEGIDVLTEFPLVQRQWDVVAQFRAQIIHKSTLSLRELSLANEETCSILIALHLLDSRPLNETLSTLLTQRSKSLQATMSWTSDTPNPTSSKSNGQASSAPNDTNGTTLLSVREILPVLKQGLSTICRTARIARAIFQSSGSEHSLALRVLESIAVDSSETEAPPNLLPDGLYLTTQNLLSHLTTSSSFSLLPPNLVNYKPYVDFDLAAASLSQETFARRLQEWFKQSCSSWQTFASKGLSGIQTVKEVWTLRTSARRWIVGFELVDAEQSHLLRIVDELCLRRTINIWTQTLLVAETEFKARLHDSIRAESTSESETAPIDFLFQASPVPTLPQSTKPSADPAFQNYQLALKRQLVGRSTQLEDVLSTLEKCARTIRGDLLHIKGLSDDESKSLVDDLSSAYQPVANHFIEQVALIIEEGNGILDETDTFEGTVSFSRITNDLASLSLFSEGIACSPETSRDFKAKVNNLRNRVIQRWKDSVVADIAQSYRAEPPSLLASSNGPSSELLQTLLSLSDQVQQLGVIHYPDQQALIARELLQSLVELWLEDVWTAVDGHSIHDVIFVKKIVELYEPALVELMESLAEKVKSKVSDATALEKLEKSAAEYLARTQTLLSILIPRPSPLATQLLQLPLPSLSANQPALDLAKPTPRFGMLLVDNV